MSGNLSSVVQRMHAREHPGVLRNELSQCISDVLVYVRLGPIDRATDNVRFSTAMRANVSAGCSSMQCDERARVLRR